MAWWVGGENQKVRLPKPYKPTTSSAARLRAEWAKLANSHAVADPKPFGLDPLLTDASPADKALTLGQSNLLDARAVPPAETRSREFFHDLSAVSVGLLTNTATGGWRKDLSLFSETWDSQATTGLPLFRVLADPAVDTKQARATAGAVKQSNSLFYPWASYGSISGSLQQPVVSWNNLIDFVRFYKRSDVSTDSSTGKRSMTTTAISMGGLTDPGLYTHLHQVRVFPVLARAQFVLSHYATSTVTGADRKYTPMLVMTPVFTMWNPYDVEINLSQPYHLDVKVLPITLSYKIGAEQSTKYNCLIYIDDVSRPIPPDSRNPNDYKLQIETSNGNRVVYKIPEGLKLKPGETRVYSVDPSVKSPLTNYGSQVLLQPGRKARAEGIGLR